MNKKRIILITAIALVLIAEIVLLFIVCKGNDSLEMVYDDYYKGVDLTNEQEDLSVLPSNEYYKKYYKIINTTKANESKKTMSVDEVNEFLKNRGFKNYELEIDYSIDGKFLEDEVIEKKSNEKYPIYQFVYVTNDKDVWSIYVIEDSIYAYPVSYMVSNVKKLDKEILVSESSDITVYSSDLNNYYTLKPNKNLIDVRLVKEINVITLNKYKFE